MVISPKQPLCVKSLCVFQNCQSTCSKALCLELECLTAGIAIQANSVCLANDLA